MLSQAIRSTITRVITLMKLYTICELRKKENIRDNNFNVTINGISIALNNIVRVGLLIIFYQVARSHFT